MTETEEKVRTFPLSKQYALVGLIIATIYIIGAAFLIQAPNNDEKLTIEIPMTGSVPAPVCPSRTVTGVPCPVCGITTSSMLFFDRDFAGSFQSHPLGPVIAILFIASIPYNLWRLAGKGVEHDLPDDEERKRNRKIWLSVLGVIFLSWILSLLRHFHLINW